MVTDDVPRLVRVMFCGALEVSTFYLNFVLKLRLAGEKLITVPVSLSPAFFCPGFLTRIA
jgi:hypothetical protein